MSLIPFSLFDDDDFFSTALRAFPGASSRAVAQSGGNQSVYTRGVPVDISETPTEFELKADIPGVNKEDIKLTVNGDVLSLSVEKTAGKEEDKEENGIKYHRVERSSTFARRSIRMPESADLSKIAARYQDGVLQLNVHKHEDKTPKQRQIAIE
ncbi:hypothetical protein WJX72_002796 [[Myrmecia] bisecta]|uniref:SHSP domain-containing protein n=1 Tax=[Myrmecia] bisecta TaxID=41462 RepID=A0AAW1P8G8_9CHLO